MNDIKDNSIVTVTQTNHIIEVQYMEKINGKMPIRKLDKNRYVNLETGEVCEFNHMTSRADSYKNLRDTFKRLRYLINNNFTGLDNELFITLTYAENMQDTKRLYNDFEKLIKKMRYKYGKLDYISIVEPQSRGAWHMHCLFRFYDLEDVFIQNSELNNLWGHGFVRINKLKDVDNIGAYLSSYLCDIELDEKEAIHRTTRIDKQAQNVIKKGDKYYAKGSRLSLYPPGVNIYRKSKGIVFPERKKMMYENVKKITGSHTPDYSKKYDIDADGYTNTIIFENYNLKRKK